MLFAVMDLWAAVKKGYNRLEWLIGSGMNNNTRNQTDRTRKGQVITVLKVIGVGCVLSQESLYVSRNQRIRAYVRM